MIFHGELLVITRSHDPRPGLAGGLRPAVAHASDQKSDGLAMEGPWRMDGSHG